MEQEEVLDIFKKAGALLTGHFRLTSGLHSRQYLQCALVLQHPPYASILGSELARRLLSLEAKPEVVAAPALGGILVAHEVARALGVRSLFAERQDGALTLRRGFRLEAGQTCFVVEDVVTTGGSTRETIEVVRRAGGLVTAAGCLVNRSAGRTELGLPSAALAALDIPTYPPEACPLCAEGTPAVKPGSR
ncbi:MAG: orotate phosphoribosyltransferase [Acidobacteriota bacterium]